MAMILEFLLLNAAACTALASLVWLAGLLPAVRRRPALRYGLWMIVLVKLVTPPIVELRMLPHWRHLTQSSPVVPAAKADIPIDVAIDTTAQILVPMEATVPLLLEPVATLAPSMDWKPWLLAGHTAGVVIILALSLRQIRRLRRALRHCECDDPRISDIVQQASATMGMTKPPIVSLVNASVPPLLWVGRGGPLIVLPSGLVDELSDEQLTCVVSHEMAHYLRRDHWGNAASWLVSAVFWWHPVVWWVRRELRTTQEACCDALVISRSVVSRQSYAKTLFQALEFLQSHRAPVPALASGFGGKSSTQRRFEMIANPKVNHRLSWWNYLLLLAALAALPFWPGLSSAEDVCLGDCPPAVQTTLQALQGAGQIIKIERDADGEEQFYEAEVAINGKVYDVRVSGQGTLLSTVYSRVADQANPSITLTFNGTELLGEISEAPGPSIEFLGPIPSLIDEFNSDAGVQGVFVIEGQQLSLQNLEGQLEILVQDEAAAAEAAVRDEIRVRIAQDQAAQVEQLQAEIARLMEQLKLLETDAERSQHQQDMLQRVLRELETAQERVAETERMRAVEAEERARAELDAQVLELEARQRQADVQAEIILRDRIVREHVAQQQQLAEEQQRLAERQVQQAEQMIARRRLGEGLPEAIRNTLDREAAGAGLLQVTVTADDAGAVTYTAQVRYQTDAGPRVYEIAISEQGELLHKRLLRLPEMQSIEVTPEDVRSRSYDSIEGAADGSADAEQTQEIQEEHIHYLELVPAEHQLEEGHIHFYELIPGEASSADATRVDDLQVDVVAPEAGAYLELRSEILDSGEVQIEAVPVQEQLLPDVEATLDIPSLGPAVQDETLELILEGGLILEGSDTTEIRIDFATEEPAAEESPAVLEPSDLEPPVEATLTEEPAVLEPAPEEAPAETVAP